MITPTSTSWQHAVRPGARIGHVIEAHDTIGSTNDRMRELLEADAPDGVVVVAELQTAGRGRMGRSWTSPPGRNLTLSIGLRPSVAAADAWQLGLGVALAARAAADRQAAVELKWPNDLVDGEGRKLAGLLVETASDGHRLRHAIVGIGLNVNWMAEEMPAELAATSTSLATLAGRAIDRVELLRDLLAAVEEEVAAVEAGRSPLARYAAACQTLGQRVSVEEPNGPVEGIAAGLDDRGALIVRTDDGHEHSVTSGEVQRVRGAGRA